MTCRFPGCSASPPKCAISIMRSRIRWGRRIRRTCAVAAANITLLKTFHDGEGGWSDRQYPDGRIEWTAPTGRTYTTYPGRGWPSDWGVTTAELPPPPVDTPAPANQGLQMPNAVAPAGADRRPASKNRRAHNDTS